MVSTDDEHARQVRQGVRQALTTVKGLSNNRDIAEKTAELLSSPSFGFHGCALGLGKADRSFQQIEELSNNVSRAKNNNYGNFDPKPYDNHRDSLQMIVQGIQQLEKKSSSPTHDIPAPDPPFKDASFVYIPTLRGMRLGTNEEDLKFAYFDRTWADYIKGKNHTGHSQKDDINQARTQMSGKTVFTGLDLYDVLTDRLLGSLADRQFIRQYEEYLSKAFFRDQPVALIPRREHDTVNIKIATEAERPVQSLGDGLQQLIILTLPMFERREKPLFLFIEEPDLFLHPGFQRAFIDAIFDHPNPDRLSHRIGG